MVKIREITYKSYGTCVELSNGLVDVCVTTDVGPRIIRYGFIGKENMMHEDTARRGCEKGDVFDRFYGAGSAWYSYGGHRLWASPEALPRTYYPDNAPVAYKINGNTVTFTPAEQKENHLQMQIAVTLADGTSKVTVSHTITNTGGTPVTCAAWALSVMAKGGLCAVEQTSRDTGLLHNRAVALWPYAKMNDRRVHWGERFITLQQETGHPSPFKLGTTNESGYALYFNHECMFIKRYCHALEGVYPDGGMSFETYTNDDFIEVETLSPLKTLKCGESVCHTETWQLYSGVAMPQAGDEAALSALVDKYC